MCLKNQFVPRTECSVSITKSHLLELHTAPMAVKLLVQYIHRQINFKVLRVCNVVHRQAVATETQQIQMSLLRRRNQFSSSPSQLDHFSETAHNSSIDGIVSLT